MCPFVISQMDNIPALALQISFSKKKKKIKTAFCSSKFLFVLSFYLLVTDTGSSQEHVLISHYPLISVVFQAG